MSGTGRRAGPRPAARADAAEDPPFYGPTLQATLTRRFAGPPPNLRPVVQVPEHMELAILRSLAREPAERFATADAFAAALSGAPVPG